jgi:hypothetical protein
MRLGEALVSLGTIGPAQLVRELARQLEDRVIALGGWRAGELRFYPGVSLGQSHHIRARETTLELFSRLVREEYPPGDIAALLRPLTKEALSRRPSGAERLHQLGLTSPEASVAELVDGAATLRDVVAQAMQNGTSMSDALRAVFIALSAGCVDAPSWRHAAPTIPPGLATKP